MNTHAVRRILAISAAALGLVMGVGAGAHAQAGYNDGPIEAAVSFDTCAAKLQAGTSLSNGMLYLRGLFTLYTSSRGLPCNGWLQVSTDSGHTWTRKGEVHTGSGGVFATTSYYFDGASNYRARVCTGDLLWDTSYSCSASF